MTGNRTFNTRKQPSSLLTTIMAYNNMVQRCSLLILSMLIAFSCLFNPTAALAQAQTADVQHTMNNTDLLWRSNLKIDPATLGLSLQIPLGAYPGRAGTGFPVTIQYSSKVWRVNYTNMIGNSETNATETNTMSFVDRVCYESGVCWSEVPVYAYFPPSRRTQVLTEPVFAENSVSGWTSSLDPAWIDWATMFEAYDPAGGTNECIFNGTTYPCQFISRIQVHLPDGSTHELRRDDTPRTTINLNGVFYAVDGSSLRFETASNTLFMPDGSRYIFNPRSTNSIIQKSTQYIDRNGNTLTYNLTTRQWTDTLGRVIGVPLPIDPTYNSDQAQGVTTPAEGDYQYNVLGLNGTPITYTFRWRKLADVRTDPSQPLRYRGDKKFSYGNPGLPTPNLFTTIGRNYVCSSVDLFNPTVLHEIVLPNGSSYRFTYNIYGEIDKVFYPTGAYERYVYQAVAGQSFLEPSYAQGNRGVVERWVSVKGDGTDEQHWQYSTGITPRSITAPDGTRTELLYYPSLGRNNIDYGFEDARTGIVKETRNYSATNVLLSRSLSEWVSTGPTLGGASMAMRDPRMSRSVSIIFESTSSQSLATLSETEYVQNNSTPDLEYFSHLHVKRAKQYHFAVLDLNTAQNGDFQTIAALFTADKLARISETDYLYSADYKARNINGLATEQRVLKPDGTVVAKSQIFYDEPTYAPISYGVTLPSWVDPGPNAKRGQVTTTRSYYDIANNLYIEAHAQTDQFGNVVKAWDAKGNLSQVEFSPSYNYAYPTRAITAIPDPTGQKGSQQAFETTTIYDFNTGLALSVTDANGQIITTEYNDPLLRPTKTISPNGAVVIVEYSDDPNNPGGLYIRKKAQIDAANFAESTTYFDKLGRTIKTQTKDNGGDVFIETLYDNMGRIWKTSNPYRQGEEKSWVETVFDEAGRVKEIVHPKIANEPTPAKIKSEYALATTGNEIGILLTGVNQAGKKGRSITNALGQIIRVDEPDKSSGDLGPVVNPTQPTYYTYDILGNLRKVTQGNQTRYFMYDSLGRLIRVKQPEQDFNPDLTITDPVTNNSQWSAATSYDNNGNVLTSTDAKGVTINYAYDNLNRIIQRSYSIPQTTDPKKVTYSTSTVNLKYDGLLSPTPDNPNPAVVQFAKGALTEISNGTSTTQITGFDNLGRVLSSKQITDGQVYPFTYTYNLSGGLVSEKYPSGRVVKQVFGSDGDLIRVFGKNVNRPEQNYASGFRYTSRGDVDQIQLGNGRWETYQFNSRNQVTQRALGTSPTDTSLWKVNYDYGRVNPDNTIDVAQNDGNIIRQTITVSGMTHPFVQTYKYDSINRLVEATEMFGNEQTWKQTFDYDRYGNRTSFSQIIGQTQLVLNNINHPAIDPLNNRFQAGQGYEYDFNGNLIQDAEGRKFSFDADNKQREVKNANNEIVATYGYDGSGRRIKKTVIATQKTTIFVYDAGGKLAEEYSTIPPPPPQNATTKYLTNDSLNTPRVITNQKGEVISRRDFLPFGEEIPVNTENRTVQFKYGQADGVRQKFTGYQKDDETQLDFAEARYYNGKHGRFTAVDPLLASGKSMNPQSFNRYVYGGNNPTRRIDPNGQDWYIDDKYEIRNGVKVKVGEVYKWYDAPMRIFGYREVTSFLQNFNTGRNIGAYVLNPWEGRAASVSSMAEAQAKIEGWRKQAIIDFIVGALEAASFVVETSGVLDGTGVHRGSQYNLGYNSTTLVTSIKVLTPAGALDRVVGAAVGKFGKEALSLIKGLSVAKKICCFVAGTPIHTDKGLVPIEQIKVGDKVLSYNEKTKRFEYKQVAHTFIGTKENLVHLKIKGEKKSLTTTTEHPFYVKKTHKARDALSSGDNDDDSEGDWVDAGKLKVGDKVLRPNGKWSRVTRIEYETKQITVYNFEVEGNHSYFVGDIGVLSHNCDITTVRNIIYKGFSKGELAEHFTKHGAEFGSITQNQYLKMAKEFAGESGDNILEEVVGNIYVKYDQATRRVLVTNTGSREIRTFYIADARDTDPFQAAVEFARTLTGR